MAEAEAAAQLGRHLRQAVSANATSSGQTSIKAARELVSLLSRETPTASRVHALAQILEDEEQRYEDLCGDNSSSHRTGYPVGRILSLVQDEDDLLEKLGHNHLLDRAKGPALHAACLWSGCRPSRCSQVSGKRRLPYCWCMRVSFFSA